MYRSIMLVLIAALLAPMALGGSDQAVLEYREKVQALEKGDVPGHYLLGLWCKQQGLVGEARLQFGKVISLEPDHRGARRELGYERSEGRWLAHDEAMRAKGLVLHEGAWMLPEEVERILLPITEREQMKAEQARVRKLLRTMQKGGPRVERMAVKALDGIEDRYKVEPMSYALRYPTENVRLFVAEELGRIKDKRAIRPLIYRSLVDPSEGVRDAALTSVANFGDPNAIAPYIKALGSGNQSLRINAVKAVGHLGDIRGVEYLVYHLSAHGGGVGTSSHIYLANQLSFVQDFDVEVAQTAFIADPIVGIIQEGQILDVRVLATTREADILERRVIRSSLKKLTNEDFGEDAVAWGKWWVKNKEDLLAESN
jgi:hypothetical protein